MPVRFWHQPKCEGRYLVWWEHGGIIGDCDWGGWFRYLRSRGDRDWLLNFTLVRLDVEWATYAANRLEITVGVLGFILLVTHTFGWGEKDR